MATKKSNLKSSQVKKPIKKKAVKKEYPKCEVCGSILHKTEKCYGYATRPNRKIEPIKEVKAPNYEPDIERLHNLVRAELAVVKAEEEKKAREKQEEAERIMNIPVFNCKRITYIGSTDNSLNVKYTGIKNWYSDRYVNSLKQTLTKRLIRSIISSLGLGATAMFLYLNT